MSRKFKSRCSIFKIFALKTSLVFSFYLLLFTASAQTIHISIDREKILLGEQVNLQIAVDSVNLSEVYVQRWPSLNDTFNHVEILKRLPVDTISVNGLLSYRQSVIITSFDSGNWQIPALSLAVHNKVSNTTKTIQSNQPVLQVLPVDVSALQEYHPIKDVIDVDVPFDWKRPLIIFLLFLAGLFIGIYFVRKRKKPIVIKQHKGAELFTMETAIHQIQQLKLNDASTSEERKQFHVEMDAITRRYFEEVLHINALKATDTEINNALAIYMQKPERKQLLSDVLDANKAVKFARFVPSTHTSEEVRNYTIELIHELDALIRQTRKYAGTMVSKY